MLSEIPFIRPHRVEGGNWADVSIAARRRRWLELDVGEG